MAKRYATSIPALMTHACRSAHTLFCLPLTMIDLNFSNQKETSALRDHLFSLFFFFEDHYPIILMTFGPHKKAKYMRAHRHTFLTWEETLMQLTLDQQGLHLHHWGQFLFCDVAPPPVPHAAEEKTKRNLFRVQENGLGSFLAHRSLYVQISGDKHTHSGAS